MKCPLEDLGALGYRRATTALSVCFVVAGCSGDKLVGRDRDHASAGVVGSGGSTASAGATVASGGTVDHLTSATVASGGLVDHLTSVSGGTGGVISTQPLQFGGASGGPPSTTSDAGGSAGASIWGGSAGVAGSTDSSIAGGMGGRVIQAGSAGTSGASTSSTGGTGPCAGLDGQWTAQLNLTAWSPTATTPWTPTPAQPPTNCWLSELGTEPAFRNEAPGRLKLSIKSSEGRCAALLYPEFGGVITADLEPTPDGLVFTPQSLTSLHWCHPMDWQISKLTLIGGMGPSVRLEARVVGMCDDVSFTANTSWSASLTHESIGQALRLKLPTGPVCGWATSPEPPLRILPWHTPSLVTALPAAEITVSTFIVGPPDPWSSTFPLSYFVAKTMTEDLRWSVFVDKAALGRIFIAHTDLASAYEGSSLAQLATKGSMYLEVIDDKNALHLAGKPCTDPIWAGGRLEVTGKQRLVFDVEKTGYDPASNAVSPTGIGVRALDPSGTAMPAPVWSKVENSQRRIATIPLAGQTEVGVEVYSAVGCTPMEAIVSPDMRIYSIRAE